MEREEFKTLAKAMRVAWTNEAFMPDQDSFDVWFSMLKDIPYRVASAAVQKYMSESPFPPTIADIRKQAAYIMQGTDDEITELKAWTMVRRAIRNGHYGAEMEFDRLPEDIQKAIGSPSYLRTCAEDTDFNESVEQSNFLRSYRTVIERKMKSNNLSIGLQNEIENIRLEMQKEKREMLVEKGET